VIASFKHRGLKRFFEGGIERGIRSDQIQRIRLVLGRLNVSRSPLDMNLPGLYLHELSGKRKGTWSVRISGNWRITFAFQGQDAINVDLEDYH